jgi:hypothetical protein
VKKPKGQQPRIFVDTLGRTWEAYPHIPKKKIGFWRSLITLDPGETWSGVFLGVCGVLMLWPIMFLIVAFTSSNDARMRYHREHGFRNPKTWG